MLEGMSCKTDEELCQLLDEFLRVARERPSLTDEVKERCGEFLRRLRHEEIRDQMTSAMLDSAMRRVKHGRLALQ